MEKKCHNYNEGLPAEKSSYNKVELSVVQKAHVDNLLEGRTLPNHIANSAEVAQH